MKLRCADSALWSVTHGCGDVRQPIGYALLDFDDEWHECGCQDPAPVALTDATDINKERSLHSWT